MSFLLRWLSLQRLLLVGYLLLWPPFLLLLARESGNAQVLGRWSWRLFCILLVFAALLALATLLLGIVFRYETFRERIVAAICRIRSSRTLRLVTALTPVVLWVACVVGLRTIGVVPSGPVMLGLLDAAALVVVWEGLLDFVGHPLEDQRMTLKRLLLSLFATTFTVAAVELTASLLGWGAYALWELNPKHLDVRFKTDEFDVRVVTNRQGLRESAEIPRRHPRTFRAITIGDSMTFGWGVENTQVYSKISEDLLRDEYGHRNTEVINMGRPGAGPQDYLKHLRRYASQLSPDLIVIGFLVGNDCPVEAPVSLENRQQAEQALAKHLAAAEFSWPERIIYRSFFLRMAHTALLRPWQAEPQRGAGGVPGPIFREPNPLAREALFRNMAADHRAAIAARYERLQDRGWIDKGLNWELNPWLLRSILFHPRGAADALAVNPKTRPLMKHEWYVCEGLLREMKRAANDAGAELIILAIPVAYQVSPESVEFLRRCGCDAPETMLTTRVVNDWLVQSCADHGIHEVDALSELRAEQSEGRELYFPQDGHLTPAGHRVLGAMLAQEIDSYLQAQTIEATFDRGGG